MDNILASFADFSTSLAYRDLSPVVIKAAKERLLDSIGCAISAYQSPSSNIGRMLAGPPSPGSVAGRILGSSDRMAADTAAFATSCMIRDLDLNDDYPGGHPSDCLGAMLAVAPEIAASGEELITSVVVAYESIISILRSVPLRDLGWDQSIAISIGAAAGLSNLLKLDNGVCRHAISITTVANAALRATRAGQLSMWKGAATAYAVRNAVFAVQLAKAGMTGPEAPFTGRHGVVQMIAGKLDLHPLGGPETNYRIPDVYTKFWPVAYSLQAVVWAGIELRKQVALDQLVSVELHTYKFSVSESGSEPAKWDPKTRETADHSIPYVLAMSMMHGTIDHESFLPQSYLDPEIRPLMGIISVHADKDIENKIRENIVELRVIAKDHSGRSYTVHIVNPLGHEKNPLSPKEMATRFESLCTPVLGASRAAEALDKWSRIESAESVVEAFEALLIR